MNFYFLAAGSLMLLIGLIHSIMGEVLIFRRMRKNGIIPTDGGSCLRERHVRIIWASWHLVSAFGWGIAAIILWLALPSVEFAKQGIIVNIALPSVLAASLLVLAGTKGKHPGWLGLLGVFILLLLGNG